MGYTFKSLCIRNFKYITNNKPLKFDFMNSNIVILDNIYEDLGECLILYVTICTNQWFCR